MRTSLGKNGYTIYKSTLQEYELHQIKKDLTVKPKICGNYGPDEPIEPIILYRENKDKIYIPRYYGVQKFGEPQKNKLDKAKNVNLDFPFSLRPQQTIIVDSYFKNIDLSSNLGGGGLICAGCGVGKTVMSLYIASKIKLKTLVIVNRGDLKDQWIERIQYFLPDAKIGFIQGSKADVDDKDIVVAMLHSISGHKYPNYVFNDFGFVIYDECHHLGARMFSQSFKKTNFKYTLGLTATLRRGDGLINIILWNLGDVVYKQGTNTDSDIDIKIYQYNNNDPKYNKEVRNFKKQIMNPIIINNIAECKKRNDFIISLLPSLIEEGRTILIITERKSQVTYMYDSIQEQKIATIGKYIGGLKRDILKESLKCRIIIGTYNMLEEGFDCKTLNTLIMATPKSDIQQTVGRILRLEKHKRTIKPLVIDIYDQFANCINKGKRRIAYYRKQKYNIDNYLIDDNQDPRTQIKLEKDNKNKKVKKAKNINYSF